jgi:hypothetical protein
VLRVLLVTISLREFPTLEELAGWPWNEDDDAPQVTEADIDVAAEIAEEDTEYTEHYEDRRRLENKWDAYTWG